MNEIFQNVENFNGTSDPAPANPHGHYFKNVRNLAEIDVYRVIRLFGVTDPALAHAVKKLLVAGGRGAGKSQEQDVKEAIVSCKRFLEMNVEDKTDAQNATVVMPVTVMQGAGCTAEEVARHVGMKDLRAKFIRQASRKMPLEVKKDLAKRRKSR